MIGLAVMLMLIVSAAANEKQTRYGGGNFAGIQHLGGAAPFGISQFRPHGGSHFQSGGIGGGFGPGGFAPGVGGFGPQSAGFNPGFVGANPGFLEAGGAGVLGTSGNIQFDCAATASQGQYGIDATCQQWCKTPQQFWGGKYVCCDERDAVCPPTRAECPKFGPAQGPVCCFVDSQCPIPTDKCCFDVCLQHKVCKRAYKPGI